MTDDEVIETFLKENNAELGRLSFRRKLRTTLGVIAVVIQLFFIGLVVIRWIEANTARNAAAQKVVDDEKAAMDEQLQKIVAAQIMERTHLENQYAYITVQYAADGHAIGCWVTQHKDDVVHLTENTPSAYAYIGNYKDYVAYGNVLHMDPKTCMVWHWQGQDP